MTLIWALGHISIEDNEISDAFPCKIVNNLLTSGNRDGLRITDRVPVNAERRKQHKIVRYERFFYTFTLMYMKL